MKEKILNCKYNKYYLIFSLIMTIVLYVMFFMPNPSKTSIKSINVYYAKYEYDAKIVDSSEDEVTKGQTVYELNPDYVKQELTDSSKNIIVRLPTALVKGKNKKFVVYTQGYYNDLQLLHRDINVNADGDLVFKESTSSYLKKYVIASKEIVINKFNDKLEEDELILLKGEVVKLDIKMKPDNSNKGKYEYQFEPKDIVECKQEGDVLRIKGKTPGKTRLSINFKDSGIGRVITIGVKDENGNIPDNGVTGDGNSTNNGNPDSSNPTPEGTNADGTVQGGDIAELDRLDFINAKKTAYEKYISKGDEYAEQIAQKKTFLSMSYDLLKGMLSGIGDNPDNLPFVYGQTLGLNTKHQLAQSGGNSSQYGGFIWPVELVNPGAAKITSLWGYQNDRAGFITQNHAGIDIGRRRNNT